jgi:hypothetical protein
MEELIAWKFIGAAVWHSALFGLATAAWHLAAAPGSLLPWRLLSLSGLAAAATLYVTSLAVIWSQRRLLAARDVPPVLAPRLGLMPHTWGGLFVARCLLRARSLASILDAAALYAAAATSGALSVAALAGASAGGLPGRRGPPLGPRTPGSWTAPGRCQRRPAPLSSCGPRMCPPALGDAA